MRLLRLLAVLGVVLFGLAIISCDSGDKDNDENGEDAKVTEDILDQDDAPVTRPDTRVEKDVEVPDKDVPIEQCIPECTAAGAQECVDAASFHVCMPNEKACLVWGVAQACAQDEECNQENGLCEAVQACQDECGKSGEKSCSEDLAWVLLCELAADGCLKWTQFESCQAPQTCADGACGAGDNDCADILVCSASCQTEQCINNCMSQSSEAGQGLYMTFMECAGNQCSQITAPSAQQQCIFDMCGEHWATCVGDWGEMGCMGILQCAQPCGMDAECQFDCLLQGSQAGHNALWALQTCLEAKCGDCAPNDSACLQKCVEEKCPTEMMTCQTN